MSVDYRHDIFISYRRDPETMVWLARHFIPLLTLRVGQELARNPIVFVDEHIEAGTSWPTRLGLALGGSRILVALWAKDYFASRWCTEEMAQMLAREKSCGMRTDANAAGLIVPAVIHDGEDFPEALAHIQRFGIQQQFNVRMARDSQRAEELDAILAERAPAIAEAINGAPQWQEKWQTSAARSFRQVLKISPPRQTRPPRYSDHG